jgi:hypothetical protein
LQKLPYHFHLCTDCLASLARPPNIIFAFYSLVKTVGATDGTVERSDFYDR